MKKDSVIRVALLLVLHSIALSCFAQEKRDSAVESLSPEDLTVGFECPSGKSSEPRLATKLHAGDITRKALELPRPKYPKEAKTAGITGKVRAEVIVDVNSGKVTWGRVIDGHLLLREAVSKVVCQARFAHALINGRPVGVRGFIIYRFGRR